MAIPTVWPMQPQIDVVRGPDKFVREARPAAGAEDRAALPEFCVNCLIPPTGVPKLDGVAPRWVELAEDRCLPRFRITMPRWKLEEKAAHPVAEDIGDHAKIGHEGFCALKPLDVSDELADFD